MRKNNIINELGSLSLIKYALYQEYRKPEWLDDLNLTQERILLTLKEHRSTSMQEVARFVGLEKGPFSQIVDKLEKMDLLKRERSQKDRRFIHLLLTCKGVTIAEKIQQHMNDHFNKVLDSLTSLEVEELCNSFITIKKIAEKILKNKTGREYADK